MQFRCDKEMRVVLVLGKGLICRQKLQIHLGMRDSSRWDHTATETSFFITMRQAQALTPTKAWTLSNSLISGLIQNHYEHWPSELRTNARNMFKKYCAQYDRGYPLLFFNLRILSCVAMVTSSTAPFFFKKNTDQEIIAMLLQDNIFEKQQAESVS